MRKYNNVIKRVLSVALTYTMVTGLISGVPVNGEEGNNEKYPYVLYAEDEELGIKINTDNLTINGTAYTNGSFVSTAKYPCVSGKLIDKDNKNINNSNDEDLILIHNKIKNEEFSDECNNHKKDYSIRNMNISIDEKIWTDGSLNLNGSTNLNKSVGAVSDISCFGGNLNVNGSGVVIYSKTGDIKISNTYVSLKGIIYAPSGTVKIDCDYFTLDGIIIAQNVIIDGKGASINYSEKWAKYVGIESEDGLASDENNSEDSDDSDNDGLTNENEEELGTNPNKADSDGDKLSDGLEVYGLGTDPLKKDSDDNGISDFNEDLDEDSLVNGKEIQKSTNPLVEDTDDDGLLDGEEVYKYFTNPLEMDTDKDGLDDGAEIKFKTNPNNEYSDVDGRRDGDIQREQTYTEKIGDEESEILEVGVSMKASGNLEKTTKIESIKEVDMLSSDVPGLIGEPVEITTDSYFDEATISFKVDKEKLGDTEFNDLMFLWYDEEHNKYVELETKHDDKNGIVSVDTTHFSRYMVVDRDKWYEAWVKDINYNPGSANAAAPTQTYNTVLTVDCSGSMLLKDWIDSGYNYGLIPLDEYVTTRDKTCNRIKAITGFVENMGDMDKAAIVFFNDKAYKKTEMTNDKDTLLDAMQELKDGGNTSFNNALSASIEIFNTETFSGNNRIILLSDGEAAYSKKILDSANAKGIEIDTVGLGEEAGDELLKEIAEYCNGDFYKAYEAEELINIYSILGFGDDFDKTDNDHDGLYDAVEAAGIRLQNGSILYGCDPTKSDTDGDGIEDGEEINPMPVCNDITEYGSYESDDNRIKGYYFSMKSNPCKKDTDDDGYEDKVERDEYNSSPLYSDVIKHRWGKDYINILEKNGDTEKIYFGGNQDFFDDSYVLTPEYIINRYGCGLISACDIILYMTIKNPDKASTFTRIATENSSGLIIDKPDYIKYVEEMDRNVIGTVRWLGVNGLSMQNCVNAYFKAYSIELRAKWGVTFSNLKKSIIKMLDEDIPVCLAIGDSKKKLKMYIPNDETMLHFPLQYDKYYETNSHYVTVTGLVEDRICNKTFLQISTWGVKCYIDFDEYCSFVEGNGLLNTTLSNILYIY
ncbi:VWA domain-containing protein [uncultured Eubacterium sp.]|uniref:vWA domain-containing protein n=1 Tax=uncultured Eubacterium sp. TaxID=165185 RepID=UPI0025951FD4|nr:VWA domain-containing protein [uncultured Eubacterium sp.]